MSDSVLMGPFLTRVEAARAAGMSPLDLVVRRDVLRIGGRSLEEVYFAFQFTSSGLRADVAGIGGIESRAILEKQLSSTLFQ